MVTDPFLRKAPAYIQADSITVSHPVQMTDESYRKQNAFMAPCSRAGREFASLLYSSIPTPVLPAQTTVPAQRSPPPSELGWPITRRHEAPEIKE